MADDIHSGAWKRMRARVMARESVCYLCGRPVDKSLPGTSPMGPSVDHVEARSRGGSVFDEQNLHLVHKICNSMKGSRTIQSFRYDQSRKKEHSRSW